jgi:tripeptide aminopeptidase
MDKRRKGDVMTVQRDRLVATFLDLVRIDSPSGGEEGAAHYCCRVLQELGFSIYVDPIFNVIAHRPGEGSPLLLNAHLDSVQPCIGITPLVDESEGIIHSDGRTVLGADDRASVAIILEALRVLSEDEKPSPPLEIIFTVQEELGLQGVRKLEFARLQSRRGVVADFDGPIGGVVVAAPYQDTITVAILGKAAHAGVAPERGINAIKVAAEAIAALPVGRIDAETTTNVGMITGGIARNIVPERVDIVAEARSLVEEKLLAQTERMRREFLRAADRHGATAQVTVTRSYDGFVTDEKDPMVMLVSEAARRLGITPRYLRSGGGSDTNILRAHGIDAVAISVGYEEIHTTDERIRIGDMVLATEQLLEIINLARW